MQAWRADRFGEPGEVLELQQVDLPPPGPGQIAMRVLAAGMALPDVLMLQGRYPTVKAPPVSPGMEAVGIVTAVGADAAHAVGDRVMATTRSTGGWGGFAEHCLADASRAFPVPAGMGDIEAAGFVIPYKTAHIALVHRCRLQPGEWLLVLGAAGSSGAAAIQLGKAIGARVIAVASSPAKIAFCTANGADHVINYREEDLGERVRAITGGHGADVVFDPVGGDLAQQALRHTARLGRFGLVGFASGGWVELSAHTLLRANISAVGIYAGDMTQAEIDQTVAELTAHAEAGRIRSLVSRSFAFDQVPAALAVQQAGDFLGKLAVVVSAS